MVGIINDKKPKKEGEEGHLSPNALKGRMQVPTKMQAQFERILVAGQKVMFDPSTHGMMAEELKKPGPMGKKIGEGIAGLMGLLMQESNNSIPAELIIPAGIVLLAHAVDFLKKGGQEVSDAEFGEAAGVFVDTILGAAKLDSNKVIANIESRTRKQGEVTPLVGGGQKPAETEQPAEPEEPAPEAEPVEGEE